MWNVPCGVCIVLTFVNNTCLNKELDEVCISRAADRLILIFLCCQAEARSYQDCKCVGSGVFDGLQDH